jgi:hypothetical protein
LAADRRRSCLLTASTSIPFLDGQRGFARRRLQKMDVSFSFRMVNIWYSIFDKGGRQQIITGLISVLGSAEDDKGANSPDRQRSR